MALIRTPTQIMELLAHETKTRPGKVGRTLGGLPLADNSVLFACDQFAMRTDNGHAFHYVKGEGVTVELAEGADPADVELWLSGSVYTAVACLNGLYPIHASAVAYRGQVHAFTGPSGAGKSTLVAGLGRLGLTLFCDDTLLLDLSHPKQIIALPGHKRLKLTDHGLALTGAEAQGLVGAGTNKSYAVPPGGTSRDPLPLGQLTFLETANTAGWISVVGSEKFALLEDDHYTQRYYIEAQKPKPETLFAVRARLAKEIPMARLKRSMSADGFALSLELARKQIVEFNTKEP